MRPSRYTFLALLASLLISCEYTQHQPIEQWQFRVEQISKAEIVSVLDRFARENEFSKMQDGDEGMLPGKAAVFVFAIYRDQSEYQVQVQNVLDEQCFSAAVYNFGSGSDSKAREISSKLQSLLKHEYQHRFSIYEDQQCRVGR